MTDGSLDADATRLAAVGCRVEDTRLAVIGCRVENASMKIADSCKWLQPCEHRDRNA